MRQTFYLDALLWRCLGLLTLAQVLAESILYGESDTPGAALILCYAASTVLVGYLLMPGKAQDTAVSIAPLLSWSAVVTASTALLVAVHAGSSATPALLLALSIGVFTLMLLLGSLMLFFAMFTGSRIMAHRLVLGLCLLCASAPLWLGPVAEQLAPGTAISSAIIAVSPPGYLAVMIDYDFLRSAWFYQHTPLGSLRYTYLTPALLTAMYLLLTTLLLLGRRVAQRTGYRHRAHHQPLIHSHQEPLS